MNISLRVIERRARYGMGIVSVVMVLGLIAYKAGLITQQTSYKPEAWYQTSNYGELVVMREFADEAHCRKEENSGVACRSGKAMADQARAESTSIQIQ